MSWPLGEDFGAELILLNAIQRRDWKTFERTLIFSRFLWGSPTVLQSTQRVRIVEQSTLPAPAKLDTALHVCYDLCKSAVQG